MNHVRKKYKIYASMIKNISNVMKKPVIQAIRIYQVIFSTLLKNLLGTQRFCRFEVTCSDFAIDSIKKYGVLKGTSQGIVRILKCQPFYRKAAI